MAFIIVIISLLGCIAFEYFKSGLIRSFVLFINSLICSVLAFGFYENLAKVLISPKGGFLSNWSQTLSFLFLFAIPLACLQLASMFLLSKKVDLGYKIEKASTVICSLLAGLIISGSILTCLAFSPLSAGKPYSRFDPENPDPENPSMSFLNTDGFATALFKIISSGSLSGKNNFSVIHSDFLDHSYLNRIKIDTISNLSSHDLLAKKNSYWVLEEEISDKSDNVIEAETGHELSLVRIGFTKNLLKENATVLPAQLRVINAEPENKETTTVSYPIGYFRSANKVKLTGLDEPLKIESGQFSDNVKYIDFLFNIPQGQKPELVGFKQTNYAQISISTPPQTVEPFIPLAECETQTARILSIQDILIRPVQLSTFESVQNNIKLKISDLDEFEKFQNPRSLVSAESEDSKIVAAKSILIFDPESSKSYLQAIGFAPQDQNDPNNEKAKTRFSVASRKKENSVLDLLKIPQNYQGLILQCSNPITSEIINDKQLPSLVEIDGTTHRPAGIIASGTVSSNLVSQFEYAGRNQENEKIGLNLDEIGVTTESFTDIVWITETTEQIHEFYLIYLVKKDQVTFIDHILTLNKKAGFEDKECFFVE